MPAIYIDTCYLKDILAAIPELPPHNWLITDLECYDYCGWPGSEKWAKTELFLTDDELRRDINLRNMQIIWGVFSAIPIEYSKEDIYKYPLPKSQTPYYMSSRIVPQHPLSVLELYADDGSATLVSAHDPALLQPLYRLPYQTRDEEADNQRLNSHLRRIQDMLRAQVPDVPPLVANEVQWNVWRKLFMQNSFPVDDDRLRAAVMREYNIQIRPGQSFRTTFWDPYTQE